jgi:hypothetical protein
MPDLFVDQLELPCRAHLRRAECVNTTTPLFVQIYSSKEGLGPARSRDCCTRFSG